jgi:hypothetical protein
MSRNKPPLRGPGGARRVVRRRATLGPATGKRVVHEPVGQWGLGSEREGVLRPAPSSL